MIFRKRLEPSGVPVTPPPATLDGELPVASGGGRTVIGPQTRVRGVLKGDGSIVVRGSVQGEIAIGGGLSVEVGGRLEADVEAGSAELAGEARGTLRVTSRVVLSSTGVFDGKMATPILEVHPGSVLRGSARVAGVPSPDRRSLWH
jgi:cytoskeletal protein CcmA (bactofilin family)